jgi:hypothetical protein
MQGARYWCRFQGCDLVIPMWQIGEAISTWVCQATIRKDWSWTIVDNVFGECHASCMLNTPFIAAREKYVLTWVYIHGPNEWQVLPSISKFVEFYRLVLHKNMQLHSSKIKYGDIFHSFDNFYVFYASRKNRSVSLVTSHEKAIFT